MKNKKRLVVTSAVAVALIGGGTGVVIAQGGPDNEVAITGEALEKASAAALSHTGSGRVTETEVGDEDGYYEVEVTLGKGKQVDVHLDQDFKVLSTKVDKEDPKGDRGPEG